MYGDQQSHDPRGYSTDAWSQHERFEEEHTRARHSDEIVPPYMYPADMRSSPLPNLCRQNAIPTWTEFKITIIHPKEMQAI